MSSSNFKRVEELFHQAVAIPATERSAFLDRVCAGDAELRAAVESLLHHDDEDTKTGSVFAGPLAQHADLLRLNWDTFLETAARRGLGPPLPVIPGYDVLAEIGRGGVGIVYRARQKSLKRVVALKMLLPDMSAAAESLARFRAEAEALARLHHPNIVPIYDIGEFQGRPYFTMEYVPGPSLAQLLDGRPQDVSASAHLLEALARTLQAVHEAGFIHRDLKPANILLQRLEVQDQSTGENRVGPLASDLRRLTSDLCPRVTDFGLVKDRSADQSLTQTGMAMGTPSYMAPEQTASSKSTIGPAADIYSLGAILYELLTGRPPFIGDTIAETLTQLRHQEPISPKRLRPKLPRDLVTICLKCLEKSPGRRYASADALAEDLRRFQAGEPIKARPVGYLESAIRWCRRQPLVAGLLALCGLLVVALVSVVLVYNARLAERAENERQQIVQLNIIIGDRALEEGDAFTALLRFTEALRLDQGHSEHDHRMRIATALRQSPVLVQVQHLNDLVLAEPPKSTAISPDGRFLALLGTAPSVRVWNLQTGESRSRDVEFDTAVARLAYQPDGRLLLTQHLKGRIQVCDMSTPDAHPPKEYPVPDAAFAALSDDGQWLFSLDGSRVGNVWDMTNGKASSGQVRLKEGVKQAAVSPDGRRLALVSEDNALTVWDVSAGKEMCDSAPLPFDVHQVKFSPGAEHIAIVGSGGNSEVLKVQGGQLRFELPRRDRSGTAIHFSSDDSSVLLVDGVGKARLWDLEKGRIQTPHLCPDGSLATAAFLQDGRDVVTVSTNGTAFTWHLPKTREDDDVRSTEVTPDDRPLGELLTLAHVLAGAQIDEKEERRALSTDAILAAWNRLPHTK
jgi:serine/threonine protein kinase